MPMSLTGRSIWTTVLCRSLVFAAQLPALIHSLNRDLSRDVRGQSNAFWCRTDGRSGCSPRLWEREWLIFPTIWISFNCSFVSNQWLVSRSLRWSILSICSSTPLVSRTAVTWQRTITMDSLKLSSPLRMLQRRKNDETLFIEVNLRADLFWTESTERPVESWRERTDSVLKINCPHCLSKIDWRTIETFVNCSMNKWNEHPNLPSISVVCSSHSAASSSRWIHIGFGIWDEARLRDPQESVSVVERLPRV